jgi:hypothetical protein
LFAGSGNQYVFGGVSWAKGMILVGEADPETSGIGEAAVWASSDNAHWQRIPDRGRTFSNAAIKGVATSGPTLVAVGFTGAVGVAWISSDATQWQQVPDRGGVLGDFVPFGVAGGALGFVVYGAGPKGTAGLAFSPDGLHWQPVDPGGVFAGSSLSGVTATDQGFAAVGSNDGSQSNGVFRQGGYAAAWWSSDGLNWHRSDVGSGAYGLQSVQPWIGSLRAVGFPPCLSCIGPPLEWRSTDGGRTWRQLPMPTATYVGSTQLLVNGGAVSLQGQPQQVSWSTDGDTWHELAMTGSRPPDDALALIAGGQTVIALASSSSRNGKDGVDMHVFAGRLR